MDDLFRVPGQGGPYNIHGITSSTLIPAAIHPVITLNIVQRDYGDAYWTALDNLSNGHWLEDIYDALDPKLTLHTI